MEIRRVKGNTYCTDIRGTFIGIYMAGNRQVVLIDSGRYESVELLNWLEEKKLKVRAVIHTHLHVDHVANSAQLRQKYGAHLYAPEEDEFFDEVEFDAIPVSSDSHSLTVKDLPQHRFGIVSTPGHCPGHQMIITPDNVAFAGDAILTEDFIPKAIIPYMVDVMEALESMETVRNADAEAFVCSHLGIVAKEKISRTVDLNIQEESRLFDLLEKTAEKPMDQEKLADAFMKNAGVFNPQSRRYDYMIDTVTGRIDELLKQGRLVRSKGLIHS